MTDQEWQNNFRRMYDTEIMRKCERHNKKVEQTNEEWFCGLSTEEKAKWLNQQLMYAAAAREQGYFTVDGLIKWLKEKHE